MGKCIGCQMQGCRAELTERGLHRYEGFNICTNCHDSIFRNRTYGPGEGGETLEQKKAREEAERLAAEERERAKRERRCPECGNKTWRGLRNAGRRPLLPPGLYKVRRLFRP